MKKVLGSLLVSLGMGVLAISALAANSTVVPTTGAHRLGTTGTLEITLTLNGNTLNQITCRAVPLVLNTDYTVAGNVYTILAAYLNAQPVGDLTLTFGMSGGADPATVVTILPGELASFTVAGIPDPVTAGTPGSPTVTAKDVYGNVKTDYTGTIRFSSDDGNAVLPANYTFVAGDNGAHTFTDGVTLKTAGEKYVRVVVPNDIQEGRQSNITVTAGAATVIRVETAADGSGGIVPAQTVISGASVTNYAVSRDTYANFVANVAAASWGLTNIIGGVVTGDLVTSGDMKSSVFTGAATGMATIVATSAALPINVSGVITVTAGGLRSFTVEGIPDPVLAGTPGSPTVTARDAYGNIKADYSGTIRFSSDDGNAVLPEDYTFLAADSGVHTFTNGVTLKTAGEKYVGVTDGIKEGRQANITVTPLEAPAGVEASAGKYTNKIRITWQPVPGAVGYEVWRSQTNDANTAVQIANLLSTVNYYDDYTVSPILSYYYWVRAKTATLVSPMSYVGMGYVAFDPNLAEGTADIMVYDLVFLPVNATNNSPAGTVSCRLLNNGSMSMTNRIVQFDFYMVADKGTVAFIGADQKALTLAAGAEELVILTPQARRGLTMRGDLSGVQAVQLTVRHLAPLNDPNLTNNTTTAAGLVRIKTSGVNSPGRSLNDYDGDGKADGCLYQSVLGRWFMEQSGDRYGADLSQGDVGMGWTPIPGDYDGDGLTDVAAYNRASGQWLVKCSSNGMVGEIWFGGPGFQVVKCDFDGDALTDPLVYREADGYWAGLASSRDYAFCAISFGGPGDQPVMADYDGDRLADPAIYNQKTGVWSILFSNSGYQLITGTFGGVGYIPASADYDGDGSIDPAIYAPSRAEWQILMSSTLETRGEYTWWGGVGGNINGAPIPADYDGDGLADLAVYHQDTSLWEVILSTQGYQLFWGLFGGPGYQPVVE